jgi:hypothetical protein
VSLIAKYAYLKLKEFVVYDLNSFKVFKGKSASIWKILILTLVYYSRGGRACFGINVFQIFAADP